MEILLEELYKADIHTDKFHHRKVMLDENSYQITGITLSGKTTLMKNYLLGCKKSSYIYIDCNDIRLNTQECNRLLPKFCKSNNITTLVYDNYREDFEIFPIPQLIIASQKSYNIDFLQPIILYPLDYEEFLAFEHKYDSSALNHFFQLGALAVMHKISQQERPLFLQKQLLYALDDVAFATFVLCAKYMAQKISAYTLYERLKQTRKISKDKLYATFEGLKERNYIHLLSKFQHPKATKKVYLSDIAFKSALSTDKNFGRLFENMVFLELLKANTQCFYEENIDFYLPQNDEIILCKPFADERRLFKKLETIEAFLFSYTITKITVITMNKEASLAHPLAKVDIIPFDIWALGD
jgi:predicted AAA+ superfamily ATPase